MSLFKQSRSGYTQLGVITTPGLIIRGRKEIRLESSNSSTKKIVISIMMEIFRRLR